MNITALNDRVVVRVAQAQTVTDSGIHIPEAAAERERPKKGTVVLVGPGKVEDRMMALRVGYEMNIDADDAARVQDEISKILMPVAPGDTVLFSKYAGSEIEIDGAQYVALAVSDLIVAIRPEPTPEPDPEAERQAAEELDAARSGRLS